MSDLFSTLFNDGGLKVDAVETPQNNSFMFRPKFSVGPNKRYEAIIRFLPNVEDPIRKSTISKYSVFLKNPVNQQGREIDCPSNVGEPDPLASMFFALRNAEKTNPHAYQLRNNFKRTQKFYSLVQIIENNAEPQTVGKIMVWCYGSTINDKIQAEQQPVMQGVEAHKPFDLFKGRLFKVVAVEKGGFNNLEQSTFFDVTYPANCMRIPQTTMGANGVPVVNYVPATREMAATTEGQQAIVNFLNSNSHSLVQFEHKPWTPEQKEYVDEVIKIHASILDGNAYTSPQQNAIVNQLANNQQNIPAQPQVNLGTGLSVGGFNAPAPTPAPAPSLGGILNSPLPSSPAPQINQIVESAPTPPSMGMGGIPGLNLGADVSSLGQNNGMTGGISGVNTSSIDSIMNASINPSAASSPAPAMGGGLSSILDDVMG